MGIFSGWRSKKVVPEQTPSTPQTRVLPSQTPQDRDLLMACEQLCKGTYPLDYSGIERLLGQGANPSAIDQGGFNALDAVALKYTLQRERFLPFGLIYMLLDQGADREHTIEWMLRESAKWKKQTSDLSSAMLARGGALGSYIPGAQEEIARHEMIGILRTYRMFEDLVVLKTGPQPRDEFDYLSTVLASVGLNVMGFKEPPKIHCVAGELDESYALGFASAGGWDLEKITMTPFRDGDGDHGFVVKHVS